MRVLLVGLGGTAGALLRYAAVRLLGSGAVPWSTFAVNVAGSFLLGLLLSVSWARLSDDVRVGLAVGVLGAFTTFSTLTAETLALVRGGQVTQPGGGVLRRVCGGRAGRGRAGGPGRQSAGCAMMQQSTQR